jgi:hypothetical protein
MGASWLAKTYPGWHDWACRREGGGWGQSRALRRRLCRPLRGRGGGGSGQGVRQPTWVWSGAAQLRLTPPVMPVHSSVLHAPLSNLWYPVSHTPCVHSAVAGPVHAVQEATDGTELKSLHSLQPLTAATASRQSVGTPRLRCVRHRAVAGALTRGAGVWRWRRVVGEHVVSRAVCDLAFPGGLAGETDAADDGVAGCAQRRTSGACEAVGHAMDGAPRTAA